MSKHKIVMDAIDIYNNYDVTREEAMKYAIESNLYDIADVISDMYDVTPEEAYARALEVASTTSSAGRCINFSMSGPGLSMASTKNERNARMNKRKAAAGAAIATGVTALGTMALNYLPQLIDYLMERGYSRAEAKRIAAEKVAEEKAKAEAKANDKSKPISEK